MHFYIGFGRPVLPTQLDDSHIKKYLSFLASERRVSKSTLQKAIKRAAATAGIAKKVSVHIMVRGAWYLDPFLVFGFKLAYSIESLDKNQIRSAA